MSKDDRGDFNKDGTVDDSDKDMLKAYYNNNYDGSYNMVDLGYLVDNYGRHFFSNIDGLDVGFRIIRNTTTTTSTIQYCNKENVSLAGFLLFFTEDLTNITYDNIIAYWNKVHSYTSGGATKTDRVLAYIRQKSVAINQPVWRDLFTVDNSNVLIGPNLADCQIAFYPNENTSVSQFGDISTDNLFLNSNSINGLLQTSIRTANSYVLMNSMTQTPLQKKMNMVFA